ncbi:MAG: hypothetical protein KA974_00315 [Saprospiraceae bacterium]|nr:hypothetical protein [Saprospiraceae bacterium]MBP7679955.1 hypothetical protein [Saprospiraceae bacterium]
MEKLQDLRYIIGLFFVIIGCMVLIASFIGAPEGATANRTYGLIYLAFGGIMYLFSRRG